MENKNLILIVSLIVVVFLAGSFILLEKQKFAGMMSKSDRLILNNPEIEILDKETGTTEWFEYSNGSMLPDCCAEGWQMVRLDEIKAGGVDGLCMFAHPRNNKELSLAFKNTKLKNKIEFKTGLNDFHLSTGEKSPVNIDVYINNALQQRVTHPDSNGWRITDIDTSQYQNKLADVKLVITAENDFQRQLCFDATVLE